MDPITLHSPADTVAAMPALLGYQPIESMCVLALTEHPETGTLKVGEGARLDLPLPERHETIYQHFRQQSDAELIGLVAYTASQEHGRSELQQAIAAYPGTVRFATLASMAGITWVDPNQPDAVQWTDPWGSTDAPARIAAAMTAAGCDPAALTRTRSDLVERYGTTVDPATSWPGVLDKATAAAVAFASVHHEPYRPEGPDARARRWQAEILDWVRGHLAAGHAGRPMGQIGAGQAAYALTRVAVGEVRDAAWLLITRTDAAHHLQLWTAAARFAGNTPDARPALFLAGMAAWIAGEAAIANIICERLHALPRAQEYSATRLLDAVLAGAVPPDVWTNYREDLIPAVFGTTEIP